MLEKIRKHGIILIWNWKHIARLELWRMGIMFATGTTGVGIPWEVGSMHEVG